MNRKCKTNEIYIDCDLKSSLHADGFCRRLQTEEPEGRHVLPFPTDTSLNIVRKNNDS